MHQQSTQVTQQGPVDSLVATFLPERFPEAIRMHGRVPVYY